MFANCPVCAHPQRHLIEQALCVAVTSPQRVATEFALGLAQIQQHQGHVVWPRRPRAACLPGLCEPYGYTPPGEAPRCRHCHEVL